MEEIIQADYGIVYLLTNPCMPGLVKIGKTSRKDLSIRMNELYTTGVPVAFECAYACRVPITQIGDLEKTLHAAFDPYRVNANREFFRINPEQAKVILRFVEGLQDATIEVTESIESSLNAQDIVASIKERSRRPSLHFFDMGVPEGSTLVYTENSSISVTVIAARKVFFDGDEYSLTAITNKLLGKPSNYGIQPTAWWMYNGRNLSEIYNETYPSFDN